MLRRFRERRELEWASFEGSLGPAESHDGLGDTPIGDACFLYPASVVAYPDRRRIAMKNRDFHQGDRDRVDQPRQSSGLSCHLLVGSAVGIGARFRSNVERNLFLEDLLGRFLEVE